MYALMRYCYHFSDSDFSYDDIRHKMKIRLKPQGKKEDNIIYELDELIEKKENLAQDL